MAELTAENQQFQVGVRIVEAKDLAGTEISPFVEITIGRQQKKTKVRKKTVSPYFDEYFVFDFNLPPSVFFDQTVQLTIKTTSNLVFTRQIAAFKLDLRTIYDQPGHQFYHKWAVLLDALEPTAGPKGYLKCDLFVLQKGDELKLQKSTGTEDDIESKMLSRNLLIPEEALADRIRAKYHIRIYHAEHLPKSVKGGPSNNLESSSALHPYVRVSFAGLLGKTSSKHGSEPIWQEEIVFTEWYPPLVQRMKIQLRDSSEQVIATSYLDMQTLIIQTPEGNLPSFGPAYINFYGSKDQSTNSNRQIENFGLGEATAYRGRLFLSLDVLTCWEPQKQSRLDMLLRRKRTRPKKEKAVQSTHLKRHRTIYPEQHPPKEEYFLFCCINDVGLIDKRYLRQPIKIKISLGQEIPETDFENRLDTAWIPLKEAPESRMETEPMLAIQKDSAYCCLPIGGAKPCLYKRFNWDNDNRRAYNCNILSKIMEKLQKLLTDVQLELESGTKSNVIKLLHRQLEEFSTYCRVQTALIQKNAVMTDDFEEFLDSEMKAYETDTSSDDDKEGKQICKITDFDRCRCRKLDGILDDMADSSRTLAKDCSKESSEFNLSKVLEEIQSMAVIFKSNIEEPQHSMPDLFVWLYVENNPIAFHRLKPAQILYSEIEEETGSNCGKMINFFLKEPASFAKTDHEASEIKAECSAYFWLGLSKDLATEGSSYLNGLPKGYRIPNTKQERPIIHSHQPHAAAKRLANTEPVLIPYPCIEYEKHADYEFRCYAYVGKNLIGSDATGLSDPYLQVTFAGQTLLSQIIDQTVCPCWEETLVIPAVRLYGDPKDIHRHPPQATVIVYDHDIMDTDDILGHFEGRCSVMRVNESYEEPKFPAKLTWYPVMRKGQMAGEVLCCFELLELGEQMDYPELPAPIQSTDQEMIIPLPDYIKPKEEMYDVEVLFFGIRDLDNFGITSAVVEMELECAATIIKSNSATVKDHVCNFNGEIVKARLKLPSNLYLWPSASLRLFQIKSFGRKELIGSTTVHKLVNFLDQKPVDPVQSNKNNNKLTPANSDANLLTRQKSVAASILNEKAGLITDYAKNASLKLISGKNGALPAVSFPTKPGQPKEKKKKFDWWNRYNKSMQIAERQAVEDDDHIDAFEVFESEIEDFYGDFQDQVKSFVLKKGANEQSKKTAVFKGTLRIIAPHTKAADMNPYSPFISPIKTDELQLLVRLYVVKAFDLHPTDPNGKADPYLIISTEKQEINDKAEHFNATLNPTFGKVYELTCTLPYESKLNIAVIDWDRFNQDDDIGETVIDLEDRWLSKHRATCGLQLTYRPNGAFAWRDSERPVQILANLCKRWSLPQPEYTNEGLNIAGKSYTVPPSEISVKERAALKALQSWEEIAGYPLVFEHLETRNLWNAASPGAVQGRLQMWVDIFPVDRAPTASPVEITPRKIEKYELRVVVYDTKDVILDDYNYVQSVAMSDIYVKGFLHQDDIQQTDVHYRSLNGEGMFNWRFVFKFDYQSSEQKILVTKKENFFSWQKSELYLPAKLTLQVWDADSFTSDDQLGTLEFDLNHMPRGKKLARTCNADQMINKKDSKSPRSTRWFSLFEQKKTRGWWPFLAKNMHGEVTLTGKVDLELELLTEEDADKKPVGLGREEPLALPEPKRPETSFAWFMSPLKFAKFIIWDGMKYKCLIALLILLGILFVLMFIYGLPNYMAAQIMRKIL